MVKNPPASAGDAGDTGSILGSGRFPGKGHGNHSSIVAWRIPLDRGAWGCYSPRGHTELDVTEVT